MAHYLPRCPICGKEMTIIKLRCDHCKITVEGEFLANKLASLTPEEQEFLELFLRTRGNVKEMERILKISYPTVRSKLDNILRSIGLTPYEEEETKSKAKEIIERLEKGEITVQDALRLLEEKKEEDS